MRKYPYVGEYDREEKFSVLFTGMGTGTVIKSSTSGYYIGYYYNDWNEEVFTPSPMEILIGGELIKEDKGKENGKKDYK